MLKNKIPAGRSIYQQPTIVRLLLLGLALAVPGASVLAQGTLERVAERGEFRIGYRTDAWPLSFEESGEPAGYSVDICRRIARAVRTNLGRPELNVAYVPVTLANRFDAVVNGDVDIECGSTTLTLGRMQRVDFSLMTYVTGGSIMSMAERPVESLNDSSLDSVAVISGTSTEDGLRAYIADNDIDIGVMRVDDAEEGIAALVRGRVEAFADDQIVLIGDALNAMEEDDDLEFYISNELFSYEPYGLMVRRNDADFRLVANRAIAAMFRSGEALVLHDTWIGSNGIAPAPLLLTMYQLEALAE